MLRTAAKIFGVVLLAVGVLGYVPALTPDGRLLGIFEVNGAHNIIHLASGAIALIAGFMSTQASRIYFQIFGVIYGLVTILGFYYMDSPLLGFVAHNIADIFLHVAITVLALVLGFGPFDREEATVVR